MAFVKLELFPQNYFKEHLPISSELQELEIEKDGTLVGYGVPNLEHNCDEMGCPTLRHVLFVLKGKPD